MEPEIREISEFKVVGLQCQTEMGKTMEDLPKLWDEYMRRIGEIKDRVQEKVGYGISIASDSSSKKFTYLAGTEVSDDNNIPEGMTSITIKSGNYIVFTHKGPVSKIGETYDYIWKEWLPKSDKKIEIKAPCIERYGENFKDDENSIMEILFLLK
jgi:AraC family transcriptional regulator